MPQTSLPSITLLGAASLSAHPLVVALLRHCFEQLFLCDDVPSLAALQVDLLAWCLNAPEAPRIHWHPIDSEVGAFYWTALALEIVNSGREGLDSVSV
jgi:hypothetical protein